MRPSSSGKQQHDTGVQQRRHLEGGRPEHIVEAGAARELAAETVERLRGPGARARDGGLQPDPGGEVRDEHGDDREQDERGDVRRVGDREGVERAAGRRSCRRATPPRRPEARDRSPNWIATATTAVRSTRSTASTPRKGWTSLATPAPPQRPEWRDQHTARRRTRRRRGRRADRLVREPARRRPPRRR